MATTKGPALALEALGSIQRTLIFSKAKGRSTVKYSANVYNPKTAKQTSNRAVMRFLATGWPEVQSVFKADWSALAAEHNISAYNAWLQYNLKEWTEFRFPTMKYPRGGFDFNCVINLATAEAQQRSIHIQLGTASMSGNYGVTLFRSTSTGFDPSPANAIWMAYWRFPMATTINYSDGPLDAGTHYYRVRTFSRYGNANDTMSNEWNATIP